MSEETLQLSSQAFSRINPLSLRNNSLILKTKVARRLPQISAVRWNPSQSRGDRSEFCQGVQRSRQSSRINNKFTERNLSEELQGY